MLREPTQPDSHRAPRTPQSEGAPPQGGAVARSDEPPAANDEILFVGLNPGAKKEIGYLLAQEATVDPVTNAEESDTITSLAAGVHTPRKLAERAEALAFVRECGLTDPQQVDRIVDIIVNAAPAIRDELAQIARVWARAERGESIPSRMVISAHNVGYGPFGEDNGGLAWATLAALAQAMPRAAAQVEDVHLAMCYGGRPAVEQVRGMFSRVKTVWAYAGSAPGTDSGARQHLQRWEKATRGRTVDLDRQRASGTRKGKNVLVWSAARGFSGPPVDLARLRESRVRGQDIGLVDRYLLGEREVDNPQSGELREYYNTLQGILANVWEYSQAFSMDADEVDECRSMRDRVIRLLYWRQVSKNFQRTHHATLQRAYTKLSEKAPDFSRLSRKDGLEAVARLRALVESRQDRSPECARALELLTGLETMDPKVIPEAWL